MVRNLKIGYIRVSTQEQNTLRQEVLLDRLGVEQIFIDKVSGKDTNRPELHTMLDFVRKGDVVIVESISRFARNTKDLLELVERLTDKGVAFVSQKEAIDTTTPTGKFMWSRPLSVSTCSQLPRPLAMKWAIPITMRWLSMWTAWSAPL